jgi:hypothetical protein
MGATAHHFRSPSPTEAIYITTRTQVVSRSSVSGTIARAQFAEALAGLERRFVILRAAIQSGHFVEKPVDAQTPLHWLDAAATTAEALYDRLLDTPLDLAAGIYAVYVISGDEGFDVFLVTSHAVTDATSLVEIHAFLIYLCDCAVRGLPAVIAEQPFPETIDDAVDHCLGILALGESETADVPRPDYSGAFLRLPTLPQDPTAQGLRHRVNRLVIEPPEMAHVAAAAHHHGVSVHCLLAAAFARAIQEISDVDASRIIMRCSVDLRRRLEPHLSTELVFSAITAHATLVEDMSQSIFAIARCIHDDIQSSTADGRIFRDYQNYPKAFGTPQDMPAELNISDMGRIHFHTEITQLRPQGFDYATGWLKPYPNVSVTIFDGRLVANTAYVEEFTPSPVIARMAEGVLRHLRLCEAALAEAE